MLTNGRVIQLFKQHQQGVARNLKSDGTSLWSYGWWEIARWVGDQIVVRAGDSYSVTTAGKHRKVWPDGDRIVNANVETPVNQGEMNI